MTITIIVSAVDEAGLNIKKQLINTFNFQKTKEIFEEEPVYQFNNIKLYTTKKESIHCEHIDRKIEAEQFIFATKHKSKANVKSLSVHIPGNWGKAEAGGEEGILCMANASLLKEMFIELNEESIKLEGYEKTLEVTHHGPLLTKAAMFIEIGSSESEWKNEEAGKVIAKTIINVLSRERKIYKTAIALGGTHYPSSFNKILLRTDIAIGHICPKHMLQYLDKNMIKQAIEKTKENIELVLLDWKGLGKEKERIVNLLKETHLKTERVQKLI